MAFHWLKSEEGGRYFGGFHTPCLVGRLVGWSFYYLGGSRFKVVCGTNHWSSPITKQQNKAPPSNFQVVLSGM